MITEKTVLLTQILTFSYFNEIPVLYFWDLSKKTSFIYFLAIFCFAINEKIRKELFIISQTNSKTKKQLMKIFNAASPKVVVSKEGAIQMYN